MVKCVQLYSISEVNFGLSEEQCFKAQICLKNNVLRLENDKFWVNISAKKDGKTVYDG